jgi:hypothetical protein
LSPALAENATPPTEDASAIAVQVILRHAAPPHQLQTSHNESSNRSTDTDAVATDAITGVLNIVAGTPPC